MQAKVCSKCRIEKPSGQFHKDRTAHDGFCSSCKECRCTFRKRRYRERRRSDPYQLWAINTVNWARGRKKYDVQVTSNDVLKLTEQQKHKCIYCAKQLNFRASMSERLDSPSLDRVDPSVGYTLTNVVVSCYRCNQIKSDATPNELRLIASKVEQLIGAKSCQ